MEYAIVTVPAAPVRRKPNHRREMSNQLLFGEAVKIIKTKGDLWVKVRSIHDGYEGWTTNTLLHEVKKNAIAGVDDNLFSALLSTIQFNGDTMHVPFASSMPLFNGKTGELGQHNYVFTGPYVKRSSQAPSAELVTQLTSRWLNAPYLWGGRTILGVDCSGFVQVIYKMMNIDLPRDAWQQAQRGKTVKRIKDAACGDLAFFDDKDEIVHVGILLNSEQIIHASGKVRIDNIDKKGITRSDNGKRTHSLRAIKRHW